MFAGIKSLASPGEGSGDVESYSKSSNKVVSSHFSGTPMSRTLLRVVASERLVGVESGVSNNQGDLKGLVRTGVARFVPLKSF